MSEGAEAMMTPDPASFRTVLGHFATGVTVIAAMEDGHPVGVAANSFTSVALDPPLVLFCAAKNSSTWPRIRNAAKFAVSILGDDQEDVCRVFASPGADRFSQIGYRLSAATGSPILHDAIAYVDCETEREVDAGDHVIVIGRVLELGVLRHADPLLYYRGGYHSLQP
jgi:3-hydroxy-9,10-secoandrosta-1,3,5(10)-triene-9,17-dione monooxygenase reductase component